MKHKYVLLELMRKYMATMDVLSKKTETDNSEKEAETNRSESNKGFNERQGK